MIHRDLKPANVKLTPDDQVKVLDFGLAKACTPEPSIASPSVLTDSPTITSPVGVTGVGVLLGTAAYMAPEQARGKAVDKRTDIWAFGCVLYEMLTARRAFPGDDVTETLATVVKLEPNWAALPSTVPSSARQAIRVCLQKDPKQRGGDMAAIRQHSMAPSKRRRRPLRALLQAGSGAEHSHLPSRRSWEQQSRGWPSRARVFRDRLG